MAPPADPYRTLGLGRDASLEEVKRAYRRLAKEHHPDTAGEAAIPRFLAIRAAYDAIAGPGAAGPGRAGTRATNPKRPWEADSERADATRRAYTARQRRTRPQRPRPAAPGGTSSDQGTPPGRDQPARPPNLATLGSTSYDGTEGQPFEPDWGGASWYGTTSGTYWTLNPKEYADPRKHGPEYQARARRRRRAAADAAGGAVGPSPEAADVPAGASEPATPAGHSTTSWWDATAGATEPVPPPGASPAPGPRTTRAEPVAPAAAAANPGSGDDAAPVRSRWLRDGRFGVVGRVAAAVIGWAPIAVAINALAGELSGCAQAAVCTAADAPLASVAQIAVLAVLLLVPLLARLTAWATVAILPVAVAGTLLVEAARGSDLAGPLSALLAIALLAAWLGGIGLAGLHESRRPAGPVS